MKIVYIGGYGRSGSTLLDIMLGTHADVMSLGEIGLLWHLMASNSEVRCSCGRACSACPRWMPIAEAMLRDNSLDALQHRALEQEGWFAGGVRLCLPRQFTNREAYRSATLRLFELLGSAASPRIFVDSSKTAYRCTWRPVSLHRTVGLDVHFIHLVRDPREVLASCLMGKNSQIAEGDFSIRPLAALSALVGWNIANVAAMLNGRLLGADRYLRVHYETLLDNPVGTLKQVGQFLGVDMSQVCQQVQNQESLDTGHLVAGNRMVRQGGVRLISRASEARHLKPWHRALCILLALPLYALMRRGR